METVRNNEKTIQRIKKLQALAKRGIGGEKETAAKMLQQMLERNDEKFSNIDILQFMRDSKETYHILSIRF